MNWNETTEELILFMDELEDLTLSVTSKPSFGMCLTWCLDGICFTIGCK